MASKRKLHKVGFLPAALRGLQNMKWTVLGALAELLDNSFGSARGNADSVKIFYDPKARILSVLDDGQGMDAIGRLFEHGNTIGHGVGDIGEYGSGGTMAILWLPSKVEIWTLRNGKVMSDSALWQSWFPKPSFDMLGVSDDWHHATLSNTPAELFECHHGTLIRMHLLPTRRFHVGNVIRDLSKMYSTGLRRGRKRIHWVTLRENDAIEDHQLVDPFLEPSASAKTISFDLVLEYRGQHLGVGGRVYLDDKTPASDSKIQIGFGFRIIRAVTECFQSPDGDEKYAGIGVSGWLDLGDGWQPYLTTTKDGIDDAPLFDALMGHVFDKIKPLLKEAENKTIDLVFEDLAVGLESALNTKGANIKVTVGEQPGREPSFGDAPGIDNPTPGPIPGEFPPPSIPDDSPGEREKLTAPRLNLLLIPTSDIQMKTVLCRTQITGDDIMILVNKDHRTVQEAMKAKPLNRLALNNLTISDLAVAIIKADHSEHLIKKIFHPPIAKAVLDLSDDHDKSRLIIRSLVDRVKSPLDRSAA
jgi:hypothetical protein